MGTRLHLVLLICCSNNFTSVSEVEKPQKKKSFMNFFRKSNSTSSITKPKHILSAGKNEANIPAPPPLPSLVYLKGPVKMPKSPSVQSSESFDEEGSTTSLTSSRSGGSGQRRIRKALDHKTSWDESGEALRVWVTNKIYDSGSKSSGRRRKLKQRKLTPTPMPIKARLAEKTVPVPKLNLDSPTNATPIKSTVTKGYISARELEAAVQKGFSISKEPKITQQNFLPNGVSTPSPPPSPTLLDIEDELSKMESTTEALRNPADKVISVHSYEQDMLSEVLEEDEDEFDEEEDDSEADYTDTETSSDDSDSTNSSDSRNKRVAQPQPMIKSGLRGFLPKQPIGGKQMGGSPRKPLAGGYSKLLRRRVIRLPTILEEPEEEALYNESVSICSQCSNTLLYTFHPPLLES